jgi:hypothetical protein
MRSERRIALDCIFADVMVLFSTLKKDCKLKLNEGGPADADLMNECK